MPKPFNASQFSPTKFSTAEDKAKFANDLWAFIKSGFNSSKWTKTLHRRLSNCFSHIAHYDSMGFWETWFSTPQQRFAWLGRIMEHTPCGDPAFTFSDVERAFQSHLFMNPEVMGQIKEAADIAERGGDEAEFERLRLKLGK